MKIDEAIFLWVAHASRVLVAASRRNDLSFCRARHLASVFRKVRDGGTPSLRPVPDETRALPRPTGVIPSHHAS